MKHTTLFIIVASFLVACNDNKSSETKTVDGSEKQAAAENTTGDNIITFKVNGESVNTTPMGISRMVAGGKHLLNLVSDRRQQPKTINISTTGFTPGTYKFANAVAALQSQGLFFYGSYSPNPQKDVLDVYSIVGGEFIISSIDTVNNILNATFSATVKNVKDEVINITEGKIINGKINPGVTYQ
jgi:hypothetical protein